MTAPAPFAAIALQPADSLAGPDGGFRIPGREHFACVHAGVIDRAAKEGLI